MRWVDDQMENTINGTYKRRRRQLDLSAFLHTIRLSIEVYIEYSLYKSNIPLIDSNIEIILKDVAVDPTGLYLRQTGN